VRSLGGKVVQGKRRIYALTAIILALCIGLTIFFIFFNPKGTIQESNAVKGQVSTDDQAMKIAMPSIEQYTTENNRTIKTLNATFYNSTKGAVWEVVAVFDPVRGTGIQDYIDGYDVSIWANNGEIYYAEEQGHY